MSIHANDSTTAAAALAGAATAAAAEGLEGITQTTTTETHVRKLGFFSRLAQKMENNPVKSILGTTAVAGVAALGGYNYNRYGSVMGAADVDDVREIAAAAAAFFA